MVFVASPYTDAAAFRRDVTSSYLAALDLTPSLADRAHAGTMTGRVVSSADLPNFFRQPFGPGWALVGDAGYHEDPLIAHGITNAFRDAGLLAEALHSWLTDQQPYTVALADYERRRNQAAMPIFDLNCQLASLTPPDEMVQLFGALSHSQADTDAFFGALEGTVPIEEFFHPDNSERIVAANAAGT